MNEQRLQAYYQLIESLSTCPSEFMQEVLLKTAESKGNPQVIYPLLEANTNKLDHTFVPLLHRWATNTLTAVEPHTATYIADVIGNFSNRISEFPLGSKANNIEIAITGYEIILSVYTHSTFPQQWAATQNNLGLAYTDRIFGERAKNIENAITAYTAALSVEIYKIFPQQWATTQNSLGDAYHKRILGERAENIENAITAFTAALEVRNRTIFPQDWASTQNNLGNAYADRILGDKADNIEQAIAAYNAALSVYTRSTFPEQWAVTQKNLGAVYHKRILGEQAENIENAIAAYTAALSVYTRSNFPEQWASTQNNLGLAYADRILGEPAENNKKAIAAFTAALEVRTSTAFPQGNAITLFNLGMLYQEEKQFDLAYNTFVSAIAIVEALRGEIVSSEEAKLKQAEEWNELYIRMVEVCIALERNSEAIEYIERSKTRNLVELILKGDLKNIFPPELVTQLEELTDKIASGQIQIQNGQAENPTVLAQHLQQLRQQRQVLQDSYLPVGFGFRFDQFQQHLEQDTVIIEWCIATDRILTFVIEPYGQELRLWQSQPAELDTLSYWINEYLKDYYEQKEQWLNQLEERLKKLAGILHLEKILAQLPEQYSRLILIPHRFLHLLPLHALPVGESYLIDLFPNGVNYAPSCQILQQVQLRQRPDFQSLFAIQNPTEDLDYANLEVESILSLFPVHNVLSKKQATKAKLSEFELQLKEANYLHFSCHGYFNLSSPLDSFLLLADAEVSFIPANAEPKKYLPVLDEEGNISKQKVLDLNKCLTLSNLFAKDFNLNQCRLVILSACETGLIDFQNTSDEYIGLPSGFLYAGSPCVVSSLWTVNDSSTAFLMMKFLQVCKNYSDKGENISVAIALKNAQMWLRNAQKEDLQELTNNFPLNPLLQMQLMRDFENIKANTKPFKSPFYWAGFTVVGQ